MLKQVSKSFFRILKSLVLRARPEIHDGNLPSGLPSSIDDNETLARFLNSKSKFSRQNGRVKYSAFIPGNDGKVSVFRHSGDPSDELWSIGSVELESTEHIYGAGMIKASDVRVLSLEVIASEPPLRHADIEGWPSVDDPDLQRSARNELALKLATEADLLLRSP